MSSNLFRVPSALRCHWPSRILPSSEGGKVPSPFAQRPVPPTRRRRKSRNVHTRRAPRHLATLAHAVELARAVRQRLAVHVVVAVRAAARADEVGGAQQRRRRRAQLGHGGDVRRQRGGVDEDVLVEAAVPAQDGRGERAGGRGGAYIASRGDMVAGEGRGGSASGGRGRVKDGLGVCTGRQETEQRERFWCVLL